MASSTFKLLTLTLAIAKAGAAYAADTMPYMNVKICNPGETNCSEVKAASTAPLATDTAAVVSLSPNGNQATSANQSTQITSLQLIDDIVGAKTPGTAATSSALTGCIYNSSGVALTNGQQAACQFDSAGQLKTAGSITSTVGSYQDKGSFIYGTDKFNPTGGIYQDTSPTLTAGQVGVSRMTQYRALHVNLRDADGDEFATINNPLIIAPANSNGVFRMGDRATAAVTRVAVQRTTYTEQTTNAQRSLVSASANDTAAGTGARTVQITYCNAAFTCDLTETVTMNGTVAVNTVSTTIAYIERVIVVTAGSTGSNAGIISLKAATGGGGATIATINATDNRTFFAHHYVGTGKTANVTAISVSHNGTTVGSGGVFILRSKALNVSDAVEIQVSDFVRLYGQASTFSRTYTSAIPIVGPARITIYVTPETSSATTYRAAMDFYEL